MSLKTVKGQERALESIITFLKKDRFPQSLLLIGPGGAGKQFTSHQIAKVLLCEEKDLDSCDECPSCIKIEKLEHPDVKVINKQDSDYIKIEQIRQLRREISLKPYEADKKIFIVENIHNLNEEAANAFLKTLEEPQENSYLILTARSDRFVLPTILSRCQQVKFDLLRQEFVEEILIDKGLNEQQARIIARMGISDLSRALEYRDSIVELRDKILKAFISRSDNVFLNAVGKGKYSLDEDKLKIYIKVTLSILRDALLYKTGILNFINLDKKNEILELSSNYSAQDLNGAIKKIDGLTRSFEQNLNFKLTWDMFFSYLNSLKKGYAYA